MAEFKKSDSNRLVGILPAKDKKIWQQLKNHTKKYAWVHYVYQGPAADEAYFIDIVRDFIRRKIDPVKAIAQHKKEKFELKIRQRQILTKLKPNDYYRRLLLVARDSVYFKIYRRDLQTCSYYYMEFVLQEIGRRLGLTLKQTRMMLPDDVSNGLLKNKVDVHELNRRLKLVIYQREGDKRKIISGKSASDFIKKNFKIEKLRTNVKEIKGTTAQAGKARGIVKVINSPEEMAKMNNGDILVSGSTNPNLMPAIRKAAAIVTDEGGLTCHAAIVSREFKIPCVVGTSFVTQVLKDGDLVEVDATRGIVRKLK
jgi:phosphohistidine swiveling domain-containing protein